MNALLTKLAVDAPIIQAPMAGVSTPAMAAAVTNAGGLGSIGLGASTVAVARSMIRAVRADTAGPFNVNLFCHQPAVADAAKEAAWLESLRPEFARYHAAPPERLSEIYQTFVGHDAMLAMLLEERPAVVSFHFGLPTPDAMAALKSAGLTLIATATSLAEGQAVERAGIDAVVAQGYEAGGHRGMFDEHAPDDRLGLFALTRVLASRLSIPVIAAGGVMDGAGIAAALQLGASAAQLGTAFIACDESAADAGYRAALASDAANHTIMTAAISGRPARCLANKFTALGERVGASAIPAYPIAYDAGKALHAAAKATGDFGYGAQWAGQGAPLTRTGSAGDLVGLLRTELEAAITKNDSSL